MDYSQYPTKTLEQLLLETKNDQDRTQISNLIRERLAQDLLKSMNPQPQYNSATTPEQEVPKTNTSKTTNSDVSQKNSGSVTHSTQVNELQLTPPLRKILLFFSGAKLAILARDDCKMEQSKYEMIGLAIIFTAVLACFSGGYAFSIIFPFYGLPYLFGLFWGTMILNLDRLIVANIKKDKKNLFQQILNSLPRLALAVLIAIVITKPLELKLFSQEINDEIVKQNEDNVISRRKKLSISIESDPEMKRLKQQRDEINDNKQLIEGKMADPRNRNRRYELKIEADQLRDALVKLDEQINQIKDGYEKKENNNSKGQLNSAKKVKQPSGRLLAQLATLESLSAKDEHVRNINVAITLMFIMLEIAPVMVKILSRYGPYDAVLEYEEAKITDFYTKKILEENFKREQELIDYKSKLEKDFNASQALQEKIRNFDISQQFSDYEKESNKNQKLQEEMRNFDIEQELFNYEELSNYKKLPGHCRKIIVEKVNSELQNSTITENIASEITNKILKQIEDELMKSDNGV